MSITIQVRSNDNKTFDFGSDVDGTVWAFNSDFSDVTTFQCRGACGDHNCKKEWPINPEMQHNGDVLDQLRKAFGTRQEDGQLRGNVWAAAAKSSPPAIGKTEFFSRAAADFLEVIDLPHAIVFARQTTVVRPGTREFMDYILGHGKRSKFSLISNALDQLNVPLAEERFGDILGPKPLQYCNRLLGSPVTGYFVEGYNKSLDGIRKEEIVRAHPNMFGYAGDTASNDLLAAIEILVRGGIVICVGDKGPGSLWAALQDNGLFGGSSSIFFLDDFTEAPTVIEDSGVLKQFAS